MDERLNLQGRRLGKAELEQVRRLREHLPQASRRALSVALARLWDWRSASGQLKDMAARSLLLKLEQRGVLSLPPRQRRGGRRLPRRVPPPEPTPARLGSPLAPLLPVQWQRVAPGSAEAARCAWYLHTHHYLGWRGPVGQHVIHLVRCRLGRDLAVLVWGAAAWRLAPRDRFIGWSDAQRAARLAWVVGQHRFLILPHVQVPHLASHLLGGAVRRLRADWAAQYHQPVVLVESFVEPARFAGTCYRAANWLSLGLSQGRSRQDRFSTLTVPRKEILLYPLVPHFRASLCAPLD